MIKNTYLIFCFAILMVSCRNKTETIEQAESNDLTEESTQAMLERLKDEGFQTWSTVDEKTGDTLVMQQYFMAFLKRGDNRNQSKAEADSLQNLHLAHLTKMYDLGYADVSGPFGDDGDMRGITIYNVPTIEMADSLANSDPMVKAGRLKIEIKPWWAGKGYGLR